MSFSATHTLNAKPTTTWVRIDHAALRHNLSVCVESLPKASVLAMIKADAYGHGAIEVSAALEKFDAVAAFGVAVVDEGISLRKSGICKRILIHAGACWLHRISDLLEFSLEPVVSSEEELLHLVSFLKTQKPNTKETLPIHLALDTGMAREGVILDVNDDPKQQKNNLEAALAPLLLLLEHASKENRIELKSVFTHLANADVVNDPQNLRQEHLFLAALRYLKEHHHLPSVVHFHNSAALLEAGSSKTSALLDFAKDSQLWTRPGICLYGADPRSEKNAGPLLNELKQVMHWHAPVVGRKRIGKNKPVSYGGNFTTQRETELAIVRVGYADGYPRCLKDKAQVLLKGQRAPVIGTICMDMIIVDVTDLIKAGISVELQDRTTLLGCDEDFSDACISLDEMARWQQTLAYEVTCRVSARVPRIILAM